MFVVNLLFFAIVTGILARLLGAGSMFDGGTAGAINYIISTIGIRILASVIGAMNPLIFLLVTYGISVFVVMHFTKLDIIRSIV